MMKRILFIIAVITLLTLSFLPVLAQHPQTGNLKYISPVANSSYGNIAISEDGRYIVFIGAQNTIPQDTNAYNDVFVYDAELDTIRLVSKSWNNNNGGQSNGNSHRVSISHNGRYIAFESDASNLIANDSNGQRDIFVYDQTTDQTTRASVSSTGIAANGFSTYVVISGDGRYVAFTSLATNLVTGDTNNSRDVFVHDLQTKQTSLVSVTSSGELRNGSAETVLDISSDGRYVAFISSAPLVDVSGIQVYLRDRYSEKTHRITRRYTDGGAPSGMTSINMRNISVSDDGRYVVFTSNGTDLIPNDFNGQVDTFLYDRQLDQTISIAYPKGADGTVTITGDGSYITFYSSVATTIPSDTNNKADVFLYQVATGAIELLSVTATGVQGDDSSFSVVLSEDKTTAAFLSHADNFASVPNTNATNLFIKSVILPLTPPIAPTLLAPTTATSTTNIDTTFSWNTVADATAYQIQIATDSNFIQVQTEETVTDPAATINLLPNNYYWRVRGKNGTLFGAWSETRTFSRLFATIPSLVAPADMTSTLDPAHTFTWDSVQDAPNYQIQISTDSAFSVSTIELYTVSNSYNYIFDAGGAYYWRVRAKNGAYVGDWSSVYSLTIQSLPAATLIAPVNWFTTPETSVELSWDAVPNATHYELIIARDGSLSVFPAVYDMGSATSYTFATAWGGIYYWTVTPYFDTLAGEATTVRQFTLDLLPTPTSPLPANNATVYSKNITFTWDAVAGATGYYVLINPYEPITNSSPIYFTNTNSYTHTFTFTGNFFWRVYAVGNTTDSGMTPMHWLIVKKFNTPNLVAPTDMTTITTSDMTFSWDAVSGGNDYQIQISTDSIFSNLLVSQTISATSYAYSFTEGGTYYWRVRAGGTNDFEGNWSPSRRVIVDTSTIPTVTLLAPAQGYVSTNRTIDFAWTPTAGATAYEFHLTTSSGYHGSLLRQTLTDTTISTSVIQNLNYYWRVRVLDGTLAGAWTTGSFSYDLLPAPTNLLPASNSIFMTASTSIGNADVTFSWDVVDNAVSYQIQIATSSNFNVPLEAVITSPTSTHNLSSTTYYWRVRAKNDLHFGYWSPAQKVSIGAIPAPTLVSPADGFATTNRTQTYSWNAVPEATSYTFQFSTYPDFDFVEHTHNTSSTSYIYTSSYSGYWRVRANKSGVGGSVWSQRAITFTRVDAPVPIAPNGDTFTAVPITLSWQPVSGATSYEVELLEAPLLYKRAGGTTSATSYNVSVVNTGLYYWRVRVSAGVSTSAWSDNIPLTIAPLPAPILDSPPDNYFTDTDPTPTLTWNPVAGATSYRLQIRTSSTTFSTLNEINTGLDTTYTVTTLSPNIYYYWRIVPTSGSLRGTPSEERQFYIRPLYTPLLIAPMNLSPVLGNDVAFTWEAVTDAETYQFQIGTSIDFTTILHDTTIATNNYNYTLDNGNGYFWRVRSLRSNGAISAWSQGRYFTVNPLPMPNLVAPADMTNNITPDISFSWDAVPDATGYEIQIARDNLFDLLVVNQTLATTSHNHIFTTPNTYYWRVRAVKGIGKGNWSDSRQLVIEKPATPTLTAPDDESITYYPDVTFSWDAVTNATSYRIQISTNSNFTAIMDEQTITTTSYQQTLALNTYYWRVRASVDILNGDWSSVRLLSIVPLPAPVIIAPMDMTDVTNPNVTFSWDAVTEATEYELQISTDGIFGTIIHTQTITTTSYNYTLPASDVYYWRVRAKNSLITGLWTFPNQLTYLLSTPNLLLPDDMTTLASSDVTLAWDSVAAALEYRIQIARDSAFTMILFDGVVGTTSHTQAFTYANTYYWRVQAIYSDWSAVRQFTIQAPPAPNLITPLDMTTTPIADVNFSWDAVAGATEYHIQIASDSGFTNPAHSHTVTTTNDAYTIPSFGTYYWRVRAKQNTLSGAWSAVRQFTIEELTAPILTAPVDMTTTDNSNLLFTWDVVASATSYQIQIATDSGFTGVVYDATPTINQHAQLVTPIGTYYWRVRAKFDGLNGVWSETRQFTLETPPPPAPTLIAPVDMSSTIENSITFSWNALPDVTEYEVQISTDSGFSTFLANRTQTQTSYTHLFTDAGVYYWRVRGKNGILDGAWTTYQFTIQKLPAPSLIAPDNMVTTTDSMFVFSWSAVAGATGYIIQLSDSPDFNGNNNALSGISTGWQMQLRLGVNYWRVLATKGQVRGEWSEVRQITLDPMPAPVVVAPAIGTVTTHIVTLTWEPVEFATRYFVEFSPTHASIYSEELTPTSRRYYLPMIFQTQTMSWRVKAGDWGANEGTWSDWQQFNLEPVGIPNIINPLHNANSEQLPIDQTIEFSWGGVFRATSYQVQISTSHLMLNPIYDETMTATTWTQTLAQGRYYWRVRGVNASGYGYWTPTSEFTAAPLPAPQNMQPDGRVHGTTQILTWDAVPNADEYQLQVAHNGYYETIDFETTVTNPIASITFPPNYPQVFWRVRALNEDGASVWSYEYFYIYGTTNLATPEDMAIISNPIVELSWELTDNIDEYQVQVAVNNNFTDPIADEIVATTSTTQTIDTPDTYYWRVRGVTDEGEGTWSDVRQFSIILPVSQEANEQELFNAMMPNLTSSFQFAIMDARPGGILTTLQFTDGTVADVMVNMTVDNGLILITLSDIVIQGGGTQAQLDTLYQDIPVMMMATLDDLLPEDYIRIESLTITDVGMSIEVIGAQP